MHIHNTTPGFINLLCDTRSEGKIRAGLKQIHAETQVIKLNNICLGELNQIRPLCIEALDEFRALAGLSLSNTHTLSYERAHTHTPSLSLTLSQHKHKRIRKVTAAEAARHRSTHKPRRHPRHPHPSPSRPRQVPRHHSRRGP